MELIGVEELKEILIKTSCEPLHAGCYMANWNDHYICDTYNGGCDGKEECKRIDAIMKGETNEIN